MANMLSDGPTADGQDDPDRRPPGGPGTRSLTDEERYWATWGRHTDARSIPYLSHLLDTAEAFQARYQARPVPDGPDGHPDPWVADMRARNDEEVAGLRRRLTELGDGAHDSAQPRDVGPVGPGA
jgi:hypothetical protein